LEGEAREIRYGIPVEEFLTPPDLFPIDPIWDRMKLIPELGKYWVCLVVVTKNGIEIESWARSLPMLFAGVLCRNLVEFSKCSCA